MCSNSIIDLFLFDLRVLFRQFVLNYIEAANIL